MRAGLAQAARRAAHGLGVLTRALAALALCGCFSPSLDGAYRCGPGGACPPGTGCAGDGICRAPAAGDLATRDAGAAHDLASCRPLTCASAGFDCGKALNGCGKIVDCGKCGGDIDGHPLVCGGTRPNVCGTGVCEPRTCLVIGGCGLFSDGCAAVLDCGPC